MTINDNAVNDAKRMTRSKWRRSHRYSYDMWNELFDLFIRIPQENPLLAYGLLFLSAMGENLLPPVPGDTVTLIGAYFVGRGHLSYSGVLISTTLGSVAGFMALFLIAYGLGWGFFEKRNIRWLKKSRLEKADRWLQKYGYSLIFANRFLSGVRSVISISAGLAKLNILKVALLSTLSSLAWNAAVIYAGAFIGKSWEEILKYINAYNKFVLYGLAIALVGYGVYYFFFRRNRLAR